MVVIFYTSIVFKPKFDILYAINTILCIFFLGRFYTCCTYAIAESIIGKKFVEKSDEGKQSFTYFVSDGIYGAFNCAPCPITGPLNLFPTILKVRTTLRTT